MHVRFGYLLVGSLVAVSAIVACTAAVPRAAALNLRDAGGGDTNIPDNPTEDTQLNASDDAQADGGKPPGKIYVHTADTLFLFDPLAANGAGTINEIAVFDCLDDGDAMLDIALDRSNKMYGTSFYGLLSISPTDAKCQYVKRSDTLNQYPNSLAFMPAGTVDATQEALVGYTYDAKSNATQFVRIDTNTGAITLIGNLNPPDPSGQGTQYGASGDIIGVSRGGNRAFLTVKQIPPALSDGGTGVATILTDVLAEVNPKTGAILSTKQETKLTQLYGLGQWAGQAYAFSGDTNGDVVKLDLESGATTRIAIDAGSPVQWYGAGMTTLAPTKP